MVTPNGIVRVTVALDPADVELLDRLAALEGSNRSAELRGILAHLRPMVRSVVEALEAALRTRDEFARVAGEAAAAELLELVPEAVRVQNAMLGAMARLEGAAAARAIVDDDQDDEEPPSSNHGGYTPTTGSPGGQ